MIPSWQCFSCMCEVAMKGTLTHVFHYRNRSYIHDVVLTCSNLCCYRLMLRAAEYSALHRGGRLFQQYIADEWAKIDQHNLSFLRTHQADIRSDLYNGLTDALEAGDINSAGRMILPSSFAGGPRYKNELYRDAMAVVAEKGTPDLFITMTCNPAWEKIRRQLLPRQAAHDRPDLIARVFRLKLNAMLEEFKEGSLGQQIAHFQVIEFQKRGLPHAHILVILIELGQAEDTQATSTMMTFAEIPWGRST